MKLLDLFCGAGGAAMGYHLAGFADITGIDDAPQPRYPFRFIQADALEFLAEHGREFDVIHASPPCQGYSKLRSLPGREGHEYPMLIDPVRQQLRSMQKPHVIENVPGAPLENPLVLEGRQFGLKVLRKRLFECRPWLMGPPVPILRRRRYCAPLSEFERGQYGFVGVYGQCFKKAVGAAAMHIDWMTRAELAQAIPPAYTEYIGRQLLNILQGGYTMDEFAQEAAEFLFGKKPGDMLSYFETQIIKSLFGNSPETVRQLELMEPVNRTRFVQQEISRLQNEVTKLRRVKGCMTKENGKLRQLTLV